MGQLCYDLLLVSAVVYQACGIKVFSGHGLNKIPPSLFYTLPGCGLRCKYSFVHYLYNIYVLSIWFPSLAWGTLALLALEGILLMKHFQLDHLIFFIQVLNREQVNPALLNPAVLYQLNSYLNK